jgi:hypothetical protein
MPEMINYVVTQTREVKVVANSVADAAVIGNAALDLMELPDPKPWGRVTSRARTTGTDVRESY